MAQTLVERYGFWHGNSPNTNPEACWEKYSGGRFQEIFRVLENGKIEMRNSFIPSPPENILKDSLEMGKFYARFCLPGEVKPTQIFGVGESLDPNLVSLPDPDEDWEVYENAFYALAAKTD